MDLGLLLGLVLMTPFLALVAIFFRFLIRLEHMPIEERLQKIVEINKAIDEAVDLFNVGLSLLARAFNRVVSIAFRGK
jgi:hypothetical protein